MGYDRTYMLRHAQPEGAVEEIVCFDVRAEAAGTASLSLVGSSERRVIELSDVRQVVDFDTGEVLAGIEQAFGGAPTLSAADLKVARGRDKREWYRPFMFDVIENHYRNKLYEVFGYRCFTCRKPGRLIEYPSMEHVPFWRGLDRDHHIPIGLGGRLRPGNIVVLCPSCNGRKHESDPRTFYSVDQLVALRPLLAKQAAALAFRFDRERWEEDRRAYLLSIGISEPLVDQVLNNSNHRYFIEPRENVESIRLTLATEGIEEKVEEIVRRELEDGRARGGG